jgi:hypothetical protein
MPERFANRWVFSAGLDPLLFVGPMVAGLGFAFYLQSSGNLTAPIFGWLYLVVYVLLDVPHVFATLFPTYLDAEYRRTHRAVLWGTPLAIFALGGLLWLTGHEVLLFGLVVYLNLFHIARQQHLYLSFTQRGEPDAAERRQDHVVLGVLLGYAYLWWHTHLPREYGLQEPAVMIEGIPRLVSDAALPAVLALVGLYALRELWAIRAGRKPINLAKYLVIGASWATYWTAGMAFNSEMAFFAIAIFMHSGTYVALVYKWGHGRWRDHPGRLAALFSGLGGGLAYVALLVGIAYVGESLADAFVRHAHGALFPLPHLDAPPALAVAVGALLFVPQVTHYVMDLYLWNGSGRTWHHLGYAPPR